MQVLKDFTISQMDPFGLLECVSWKGAIIGGRAFIKYFFGLGGVYWKEVFII